jgi:hypothetical protein
VNDTVSTQSATSASVNWRGIAWFLTICFGLTWSIEITAMARGIRFAENTIATTILFALVMFIPAMSALIVRRWITREGFASANLRIGPLKPYLLVVLGIPCLFLVISTLTCAFGLGGFSTEPYAFLKLLPPLPPGRRLLAVSVLFAYFGFISLIIAPLSNVIFTFGEEFGWTGYLLPSLLPLGRWKAVAIYGVVWGMWHAPIIAGGYNYPGHPMAGIIFMCASTTSLGLIQCSLLLRYRSVLLTSFLHATINAHTRGVWPLLMTGVTPLLGGPLGLLGTLVIGLVGSWLLGRTKERQSQ